MGKPGKAIEDSQAAPMQAAPERAGRTILQKGKREGKGRGNKGMALLLLLHAALPACFCWRLAWLASCPAVAVAQLH